MNAMTITNHPKQKIKNTRKRFFQSLITVSFLFIGIFLFCGCKKEEYPKDKSIDYTIVIGADIPKELQKIIKERKKQNFQLTYSDGSCLYLVKGYGTQNSGGYNIKINDFYQSKDYLVLNTDLFGPKKDAKVSDNASYPYIVIKTEYRDNTVIFQ